jgi:hypothetical protein
MKIQGVTLTGGIKLNTSAEPAPSPTPPGPSKFVVGAHGNDDAGDASGSAYVYNLDGTGEVKITASDGAASDLFGYRVGMSSTKIVVGSYLDDDRGSDSGSVYVYNLDGTGEQKITASDGADNDQFSNSVAISDTKVAVGATGNDNNKGAAYIYNTDGTGEVKITASDAATNDRFGSAIAVSDTKVLVGRIGAFGAAYIYNLDGTGEVKITASDGADNDQFGSSVAMTGTKIAVGSLQNDNSGDNSGAVYVYNTDGTGEQKITASDAATQNLFGSSVAMSDTKIVVGSEGVNGYAGAVYVYNTDGTGEVKITASDGAAGDYFGRTVAINGDKVIVGAYADDDAGSKSGAVYVYNTDGTGEVKITASDAATNDRFGLPVASVA